jgi:hypothetical protein
MEDMEVYVGSRSIPDWEIECPQRRAARWVHAPQGDRQTQYHVTHRSGTPYRVDTIRCRGKKEAAGRISVITPPVHCTFDGAGDDPNSEGQITFLSARKLSPKLVVDFSAHE